MALFRSTTGFAFRSNWRSSNFTLGGRSLLSNPGLNEYNISKVRSRGYCELKPLPKVNENELSDKAKDIAERLLKLDLISWCKCMDLLKEKSGIDPNAMISAGGGGGSGAAETQKVQEIVDTGFRKIVIREFIDGNLPVKDKFTIMKLMREEQPDLSLADVILFSLFILFYIKLIFFFNF